MKTQIENLNAVEGFVNTLASARRFSAELNTMATSGKAKVYPKTHYVKKVVSGLGGGQSILDENTKKIESVSSISEDRLPKNEAFIVQTLAVSYAKGAETAISSILFDDAIIGEIDNAVLSVRQEGNVLLERPISDFTYKGTETNPHEKVIMLDYPLVLRDDESIDLVVTFPKGGSVPTAVDANNEHMLQIKAYGYATRRASN